MKPIPLEQEDDSKYADHGLTIAPTASSLSLGIGSFLNEEFALRRELLLLLVSLPESFFLDFNKEVNFPRASLVELLVRQD